MYDNIVFTTELDEIISKNDIEFLFAEYTDGMFHDPPDPEYITIKLQDKELCLPRNYKRWDSRSLDNELSTLGYDMVVLADELFNYDIYPNNNEDFINNAGTKPSSNGLDCT